MDQQETAGLSRTASTLAPCRSVADFQVRDAGDGSPVVLFGHFSVFDQWTEIRSAAEGHFLERIAPGAFAKTITERGDQVRVLFQHGKDPSIGQKPLGKLIALREDAVGGYYEVELFDTEYVRELLPALRSGQLGASFQFRTVREKFTAKPQRSSENPAGLPEVTVTEAKLYELGPVTFGAYPAATAGVRSLTDEYIVDSLGGIEQARAVVARVDAMMAEDAAPMDDGDGPDNEADPDEAMDDALVAAVEANYSAACALRALVIADHAADAAEDAASEQAAPRSDKGAVTVRVAADTSPVLRALAELTAAGKEARAVTENAASAVEALADAGADDTELSAPSVRAAAPEEGTAPAERREPGKPRRQRPRRFA